MRAKSHSLNLTRPAAHSCRGTVSPSRPETPHPLLVIGNPGFDLFPAELARWWKLPRAAQPGGEKKKKFLLLLRR